MENVSSATPVDCIVSLPTHPPRLVIRYQCESKVEHEPVADDELCWLEETRQWICKGCILYTSSKSCTELERMEFPTLSDLSK
jgi:hypothetical protein